VQETLLERVFIQVLRQKQLALARIAILRKSLKSYNIYQPWKMKQNANGHTLLSAHPQALQMPMISLMIRPWKMELTSHLWVLRMKELIIKIFSRLVVF